jgi:hypothetical protein
MRSHHTIARRPANSQLSFSSDGYCILIDCYGSRMFITVDDVDPELAEPYIDKDEERTTTDPATDVTVTYRYVHGGFVGTETRFAFYFPASADYRGRFFQHTYPTVTEENAAAETIAFAISNGAYVVSTNNAGGVPVNPALGGFRANAAAAKYSRVVAAEMYGADAPVRGHLYGASGGAYQTLGGIENTSGVWDGAVPMVPGTPNSIPSYQGVVMLGLRVLGDRLPAIADALEPGGSGDPCAGLNDEQRAIFDEVTTLGFPLRGWWQHATLDGGSFWTVAGAARAIDPTYVDDFWTVPGYEGADPASSACGARVQFEASVVGVGIDGDSITLSDAPSGGLLGVDLVVTSGVPAGTVVPFVNVDGSTIAFGPGRARSTIAQLVPGDRVRIDNSWFLALQYYHRHQVPTADLYGWNQFRDAGGAPKYPQRPLLIGPMLAAASGGVATGRFEGKMIMLASALDVEAYPWSADWYHHQVRAAVGDGIDDRFRLWFMDNADHNPTTRTVAANAHIVGYDGEMHQALLDLDAWIADGVYPSPTTNYRVTAESQIEVSSDAQQRGGLQAVVQLTVAVGDDNDDGGGSAGGVSVEVAAGQPVTFTVSAELPPGTGSIVCVEWDFESTGTYSTESDLGAPRPAVDLHETHVYEAPGTHFAVVRVTADRDGDRNSPYRRIQNVARVRVIVT